MFITAAKLDSQPKRVELKKGATVADALSALGYNKDEHAKVIEGTRVNTQELRLSAKLPEEAFIVVTPQVKGGKA